MLFSVAVFASATLAAPSAVAQEREKTASIEESIALFQAEGIRNIEVSPYFREGEEVDANGVKLVMRDNGWDGALETGS